ncbi:unnamed protein product [Anisakis simplex]|uniref:Beta-lactamase-related domain-containing protein n=1 Tax=Anisakis simplex TaxID=6269 RepID=A0A3P6P671_ANISI|nr:unnamed protein product [Anisakis simplex]
MQTHPLRHPPGRRHLYSNIGYMFLGRVIEALSGQTYETFVSAEILEPLNISARIGRRQHQQRQQYEVKNVEDSLNSYCFYWWIEIITNTLQ